MKKRIIAIKAATRRSKGQTITPAFNPYNEMER